MDDLHLLLSDNWLNDNHVDFFASLFNNAASCAKPPILITGLPFSQALKSFGKKGKSLKGVGEAVLQKGFIKEIVDKVGDGRKLYTPLYLHNHWVVVCIDKDKGLVSYGEYKQCPVQLHEK